MIDILMWFATLVLIFVCIGFIAIIIVSMILLCKETIKYLKRRK